VHTLGTMGSRTDRRAAATICLALALAVAAAVGLVIGSRGDGRRETGEASRRVATGEPREGGPPAIVGADRSSADVRPARRAAAVRSSAVPTGLLAVSLRSTHEDPAPAAVGVAIRGEGGERSLHLTPPARAAIRVQPGVYEVAAVEDSRPEESRRWTLLAERSRAEAVVREGETSEVVLLVETPGSITLRAPERAAVSLDGLTLHAVGRPGALDTGRRAVDERTVAWRWLGPGTYEVRGDLLRAPHVVTLAAGEHHGAELDLDLVRVVLRPEIRAGDDGPLVAVPCSVTVSSSASGRGISTVRTATTELVGAGGALELDLPPGQYTAWVGADVRGAGAYSDLFDGGSQLAARADFGSGGAIVTAARAIRVFEAQPSERRLEVALPHTVRAREGVASIDLSVEGEGALWLHYPPTPDGRRAPRPLLREDGRIDVALDVARLHGGAIELTTSGTPGEGEVLLREVFGAGRATRRVVCPGEIAPPAPSAHAPFVIPR